MNGGCKPRVVNLHPELQRIKQKERFLLQRISAKDEVRESLVITESAKLLNKSGNEDCKLFETVGREGEG